MMHRRGFFGVLAGLAAAVALKADPRSWISVADPRVRATHITLPRGNAFPVGTVLTFRKGTGVTSILLDPRQAMRAQRAFDSCGECGVIRDRGGEWTLCNQTGGKT